METIQKTSECRRYLHRTPTATGLRNLSTSKVMVTFKGFHSNPCHYEHVIAIIYSKIAFLIIDCLVLIEFEATNTAACKVII